MLRGRERHDQHIVEALVVALLMKTGAALSKSTPLHSRPIVISLDGHSSRPRERNRFA